MPMLFSDLVTGYSVITNDGDLKKMKTLKCDV